MNEDEVVPMVLVGNKCDIEDQRQVSTEEGRNLAQDYGGIPFVECSALEALNCDEVFYEAVREIRKMDETVAQVYRCCINIACVFLRWLLKHSARSVTR